MGGVRGGLVVLKALSEGPKSVRRLVEVLEGAGVFRDERTVRRWLEVMREEGFGIQRRGRSEYALISSPVRIPFDDYETLATLSVLDSLAVREAVYGECLASAARKLRAAIPPDSLKFADAGNIEFDLESASDPPEDPTTIDILRRATHQHRRIEVTYHSLNTGAVTQRILEPVRVLRAHRAHRLYAYDPEHAEMREFRVNRIRTATMLSDVFSPAAHRSSLDEVRVRLTENAFLAYGSSIVPDDAATIERLADGGAIVSGVTPSVFWTVREISALGPDVTVLGGPKLEADYRSFLEKTLENHR